VFPWPSVDNVSKTPTLYYTTTLQSVAAGMAASQGICFSAKKNPGRNGSITTLSFS